MAGDQQLRARIEALEAENERLRGEAREVAEANVRAALKLLELSEHRQLELEDQKSKLQRALAAAEEASRRRDQFLAMVSHELRTPLNGVLGLLALVDPGPLDHDDREHIRLAIDSARHLLIIIDDILDFSKIHAGKLELVETPIDLAHVVEGVAVLCASSGHSTAVELGVFWDLGLPRRFLADSHRLQQVLVNLAANALKFTETGSVVLRVQRAGPPELPCVRLIVEDTGCGIPAEFLPSLFDPFTQAETFGTRRSGGTGLGLAICKQLVQGMGGTLRVESTVGRGTRLWCDLPLHAAGRVPAVRVSARVGCCTRSELVWRVVSDHLQAAGATVERLALGELASAGADLLLVDTRALPAAAGTAAPEPDFPPGARVVWLAPRGQRRDGPFASGELLHLPLAPSRLLDLLEPAPAPVATEASQQVEDLRDAAVLVVEDNRVNQRVVLGMLRRLGCRTEVADDGRAALDKAAQGRFDVILMDCQMPGMDGFEAVAVLRAQDGPNRSTPVVAVTANASASDRERCLKAGMDDFLAKPFSMRALAERLQLALGQGRGSDPERNCL